MNWLRVGAHGSLCISVFRPLDRVKVLAPTSESTRVDSAVSRVDQLAQDGASVADDANIRSAVVAEFRGVDVDLDELGCRAEARRREVADHIVDPSSDYQQQVRLAE